MAAANGRHGFPAFATVESPFSQEGTPEVAVRCSGRPKHCRSSELPYSIGSPGFIYCIGSNDFDPVKIGFTVGHPERRLKDVQIGCPFELRLLSFIPAMAWSEKLFHAVYAEHRIRGEWFSRQSGCVEYFYEATCHTNGSANAFGEQEWTIRRLKACSEMFPGFGMALFDACDVIPPVNGEWCKTTLWRDVFQRKAINATSTYYPAKVGNGDLKQIVASCHTAIWRYIPPCRCCGGAFRG